MGWDCTLHLVDEASLARFVARFLDGRAATATAFDRAFSDADELVARTKQLIGEDPALLAHVERAVVALVPGERTPYHPLLDVLRAAVARGCGYWEGTDLGVVQAHEDWLRPRLPSGVLVEDSAFGYGRPLARDG